MLTVSALLPCLLWLTPVSAAPPGLNGGLGPPPAEVDRSTVNATVQGFLKEAHQGHYAVAAHYLNLTGLIPDAEQAVRGKKLARRLRFVLDRQSWLDVNDLRRDPEAESSRGVEELGQVPVGKGAVPILVGRVAVPEGGAWLFTRGTVRSIDRMYDVYGPPLGEVLPEALFLRPLKGLEVWQWVGLFGAALIAVLLGYLLERLLLALASRITRMTPFKWDDQLVLAAKGPLRLMLWSGLVAAVVPPLQLPGNARGAVEFICRSLLIFAFAWLFQRFIRLASELMEASVISADDSASVRGVRTQLAVLKRVASFAIYVVAAALFLMQFPVVQTVGVSLLASAGVAGLVLGIAAQKSIGTLLAGIQLSITQPISIGDSVVVEGDSGLIEEINLTYVVVRVWDLRRLIIPITYFLDKPFQNWSKGASGMLGTVLLSVDFTADVAAFRKELRRIVEGEGRQLWDGEKAGLVVIDATDRIQTLRALVGAKNPDASWDLRCLVRERLIEFLRQHPGWMPMQRTQPVPAASPPPER